MFFPHLPAYRPSDIYADLLEWHRQVRLGSDEFVHRFTQEEFDLVVARAGLASLLACAERFPAETGGRTVAAQRAAEIADGLRRSPSASEAHAYYCRQFVELAERHGPDSARTLIDYACRRSVWAPAPGGLRIGQVEGYADKLVLATEEILRMLDFDPAPQTREPE